MDKENKKWHRHKKHHRPMQKKTDKSIQKTEEKSAEETLENTVDSVPFSEEKKVQEPSFATKNENDTAETAPNVTEEKKYRIVGVRFRPVGKTYSFDPGDANFVLGEQVVVETSQGIEFGTVSSVPRMASEKEIVLPLKKVLRKATQNDVKKNEENRELELRGRKLFQEKIQEHKLEMALSDVECSFDRSKLIFYFTSEGRVDFREFVKDMAAVLRMRIELRQIGVRDEAKQLGGLGICGRPLCCSSFLEDFQQVSIKMAKEQNLSLNPTKISGTCGRLMCCLRYENDVYVEAGKKCPRADNIVMTPKGRGVVIESNILCGKCKVKLDSDPENIVPFSAEELKLIPKQKKTQNQPNEKGEQPKLKENQ